MTLAGRAAPRPGAALADQSSAGAIPPRPAGGKKNLLCLSNNPPAHEKFIESMRSIPGTDLQVSSIKVNYQNPEEIVRTVHEQGLDIFLLILPRMTFSFGSLCDAMGDLDIPVIVLTTNPELIPIDANLSASLRGNGANVTSTISQAQARERVRIAASPGLLASGRGVFS